MWSTFLTSQWTRIVTFLAPSRGKVLFRSIVTLLVVVIAFWWRGCSSDSKSTSYTATKCPTADTSLGAPILRPPRVANRDCERTLVDSALLGTKYIDPSFTQSVAQVEKKDRTSDFVWVFIKFAALFGAYFLLRKKYESLPKLTAIGPVVVSSFITIHWLWWSLAPIWWENFYQSKSFWPINIGLVMAGVAASVAEKHGGKQIAKVIKYTMFATVVAVLFMMWPKNMNFRSNFFSDNPTPYSQPSMIQAKISPEVASVIEKHFGDLGPDTVAIMKRIALAESSGMQLKSDSSVVRNKTDGKAVGVFQIHPVNFPLCYNNHLDFYTLEGNVECARAIYNAQGLDAWKSSESDWRTNQPIISSTDTLVSTGTPVVIVNNTDEMIRIIAPPSPDTAMVEERAWSKAVYTEQKFYCFKDINNKTLTEYAIRDDLGNIMEVRVGMRGVSAPRYPKYLQFRSLGNEPVEIIFTRSRTACR